MERARGAAGHARRQAPAAPVGELALVAADPPDKLGEQIAWQIEEEVLAQGLEPGTLIGSEPELLARYGVSRAVLREAVRLLEHHDVARTRRGANGGLIVSRPRPDSVTRAMTTYLRFNSVRPKDILETRNALELTGVQLAAARIDDAGISRIRAFLAAQSEVADRAQVRYCHDFHVLVAELSANPALALFVTCLTELANRLTTVRPPGPGEGAALAHRSHQRIAEAIVAGDGALARRRMADHLSALAEFWVPGGDATE
jgi:DNA-binding FadR family transcriptional regulator